MDPITLALATFGVQKLRGKSTKRSFRDALIVGGIGQLGSMTQMGQGIGLQGFGTGAGQLGAATATTPALTTGQQFASTPVGGTLSGMWGNAPDAAKGIEGKGFLGWSKGAQIGAGLGLATLMEGDVDDPKPPFTEEDYKKAYAEQSKLTSGLSDSFQYTPSNIMYYGGPQTSDIYQYSQGGLASLPIQKFATGGVSYLPSKIDHDEKDTNNYVRAHGQVADGTGSGDKNEDTILAQLADGEFVSRSDAILGAGLIEGASPSSQEEMRKKGAAFFYSQQSKFKRIFDLLNASKKTEH